MIEKIIQIKNVGRFFNYSARGDVALRKLTLIHAENGRGKSTLCAILRSLQTGQPELILERKTLGTSEPASVSVLLNGSLFEFANNGWNATHPEMAIFDSVFVNENVYSGDYVEHEHKKNLYRVVVGARGVALARQVDDLDNRIRDINNEIRTQKDAVARHVPQGATLEQFLVMSPVEDIDTRIKQKSDEIAARERAIEKSSEIQRKELMETILLPSLPGNIAEILAKKITDVSINAEARVREHIWRYTNGQGESWLEQGLGYVRDNQCPFCSQSIQGSNLIKAYQSYFNAEYRSLKEEVAQLEERIKSAIGESALIPVQDTVFTNQMLAEFWRQFVEITVPEFPLDAVRNAFTRLRNECTGLVQTKKNNPLDPVALGGGFDTALAEVEKHRQSAYAYNRAIEACNEKIEQQKATASQKGELSALYDELSAFKSSKLRFEPQVAQACNDYQNSLDTKRELEGLKQAVKEELDRYCADILQRYERNINDYLDQFNVTFRITNTRHQYTGGTPSSQFQIEINKTPVDLGDTRTPPGCPCFRTALSSGDRSTLALALFLALLKQEQTADKIVILDDPFTSLDRFRRTCTVQLTQQLYGNAKQVIVLSHDPHFLRLLWEGCSTNDVKALQMSKRSDTTVIGEWDIEAEAQSGYMKDFSTLLDFYRERKGEPRSVARTIRPFIEGMLISHFPGHFQPTEWLGDFIGKIRDAGADSGLQHAKADLNELEAINSYSKKYHHQQNVNADTEPINEDEMHGFVKRTLRLVGGC